MSEHDVADCPKCGKRDFILKEDNIWVCLACEHTEKMPKSRFDPDSSPEFGTFLAAILIAIFMVVLLGRGVLNTPNQDLNLEPQSQN